ncbi:ABC transporter substrate-binding protein [Vogesella sp. LIG4]|uniref:substrate-binding periplasmic protein n=1 Tax=Vogesella sp. LIG4 TaxID=1192162 RepID=UPI00081F9DAC|nr:transporter substrate-binding domain-containing protein [Vogesella sp. LIG4]SCK19217.1 Predicted soluble lytic transglycosylase fused to an ABC-type amino acid-binding protein [Vogesella sp. LIG4]
MTRKLGCWLALWLALLWLAPLQAATLRVVVDDSTEMPLAELRDGLLLQGWHKDVGELLAARLGREAEFVIRPRKRLPAELNNGGADMVCGYKPEWLPGPFAWSVPVADLSEVLITPQREPRPRSLAAVAGQPVGTVLGFRYPELEAVLGTRFIRDDAPSAETNLDKLAAGRIPHVIISSLYLDYQRKRGRFKLPLHPRLLVSRSQVRCALSPGSRIELRQLNAAIRTLQAEGSLQAVLRHYR